MNAFVVFIRRPVFATMLTAFLVVVGALSYVGLGVDQFPNVEFPVVNIFTTLRGASPEEVETMVTKPIEEAINTIGGIDELRSYSLEGASYVPVTFLLDKSIAEVVQDVRDRVASIRNLPSGTDPPIVIKFDMDNQPVAGVVVFGPRDLRDLREMAEKQVKPVLETVDGVGQVFILGGWKRAVNVVLDAAKLEALNLSVAEVSRAIQSQHVDVPGGRIDRGERELGLRTLARMTNMAEFNRLVVAQRGGRQITLRDVGHVEDSNETPRALTRLWNKYDDRFRPAVVMLIRKQSGANTVELIDRVMGRLDAVRAILPSDIRVESAFEQGTFIRHSMEDVKLHLVLGALLASVVCFFFIRDLRATIIASLAIPTSIIATFALVRAMGFTINNMTMLALTLSVGIVVDDAIVVLENIFRQMEEEKKPPAQAAIDGLKEIALAVLATTFSLVIIFLPLAFMGGVVGRFFSSFGVTVAFAILISLLVSFTLTPMLCSKWLRVHAHKENRFYAVIDRVWGKLLRWSLHHRWKTVAIAIGLVLLTGPIIGALGKEAFPADDRSLFLVKVDLPEGSSLKTSEEAFRAVEYDISRLRGVKAMMVMIGDTLRGTEDVTKGQIFVTLDPIEERKFSQADVMADARKLSRRYPGVKVAVIDLTAVGGQYAVNLDIRGPDLGELYRISNQFMDEMRKVRGFIDVDSTLTKRSPEVQVLLDRYRASDLKVSTGEVALSLRALVGGVRIGRFQEGAEQYDVWIRVRPKDRESGAVISRLPMGMQGGGTVPLEHIAKLREGRGPTEILRLNRQRSVTVYGNLDDLDLGSAMGEIFKIKAKMKFPHGYELDMGGRFKVFQEMFKNLGIAFLLAFAFMYMILAAQFESFLHPITILLSLPLVMPFAFLSLLLLGDTVNFYSLLGLFMLFGVVKKNGILQIDYTMTLRSRGIDRETAILQANHARLRPILMTTLTLIVGMIPIALGKGPGAAARASMAKVIIGGQAMSLVISLLIVPVAYSLFDDLGQKARAQLQRGWEHLLLWGVLGPGWLLLKGVAALLTLVFTWRMRRVRAVSAAMGVTPYLDLVLWVVSKWPVPRRSKAALLAGFLWTALGLLALGGVGLMVMKTEAPWKVALQALLAVALLYAGVRSLVDPRFDAWVPGTLSAIVGVLLGFVGLVAFLLVVTGKIAMFMPGAGPGGMGAMGPMGPSGGANPQALAELTAVVHPIALGALSIGNLLFGAGLLSLVARNRRPAARGEATAVVA